MRLAELRAANVTRQAEWDRDGRITPVYRSNELAGEVGEACNVVKKLERERLGISGSRDTVEHLGEELADVLICVDLLAMQYGIDLSAALVRKFNATSEKMGLQTRLPLTAGGRSMGALSGLRQLTGADPSQPDSVVLPSGCVHGNECECNEPERCNTLGCAPGDGCACVCHRSAP